MAFLWIHMGKAAPFCILTITFYAAAHTHLWQHDGKEEEDRALSLLKEKGQRGEREKEEGEAGGSGEGKGGWGVEVGVEWMAGRQAKHNLHACSPHALPPPTSHFRGGMPVVLCASQPL